MPIWRSRPSRTKRNIHDRLIVSSAARVACKYSPPPSGCIPGGAFLTPAEDSLWISLASLSTAIGVSDTSRRFVHQLCGGNQCRRCARRYGSRCYGRRKDSAGADFDRHKLHDDLQCPGGELPNRVRRAGYAADGVGDDDQQRHGGHNVLVDLYVHADRVSDDLRPAVSIAIGILPIVSG